MNEAKALASAQTHNVLPDGPHHTANASSNFSDHPELPADGSVEATLVANGGSLPDGRSLVFNRDGVVFANSHDVAAFFGKRHDHVLRSIDLLLADMNALSAPGHNASGNPGHPPNLGDGGVGRFREVRTPHPTVAGRTDRSFDMNRNGFCLLAMGFTGPKALHWKCLYITAFNRMEAGQNAALASKAAAYDLLGASRGSETITDAAKVLKVRPRWLFRRLRHERWIYQRAPNAPWRGFQDKLNAGLVEHAASRRICQDGTGRMSTNVRVTAAGIARLAELFAAEKRARGLKRMLETVKPAEARRPLNAWLLAFLGHLKGTLARCGRG